jgi:hypothetical protein
MFSRPGQVRHSTGRHREASLAKSISPGSVRAARQPHQSDLVGPELAGQAINAEHAAQCLQEPATAIIGSMPYQGRPEREKSPLLALNGNSVES